MNTITSDTDNVFDGIVDDEGNPCICFDACDGLACDCGEDIPANIATRARWAAEQAEAFANLRAEQAALRLEFPEWAAAHPNSSIQRSNRWAPPHTLLGNMYRAHGLMFSGDPYMFVLDESRPPGALPNTTRTRTAHDTNRGTRVFLGERHPLYGRTTPSPNRDDRRRSARCKPANGMIARRKITV